MAQIVEVALWLTVMMVGTEQASIATTFRTAHLSLRAMKVSTQTAFFKRTMSTTLALVLQATMLVKETQHWLTQNMTASARKILQTRSDTLFAARSHACNAAKISLLVDKKCPSISTKTPCSKEQKGNFRIHLAGMTKSSTSNSIATLLDVIVVGSR
jgi:hypothetical protein